jgi:hypothetical protein
MQCAHQQRAILVIESEHGRRVLTMLPFGSKRGGFLAAVVQVNPVYSHPMRSSRLLHTVQALEADLHYPWIARDYRSKMAVTPRYQMLRCAFADWSEIEEHRGDKRGRVRAPGQNNSSARFAEHIHSLLGDAV